MGQTAPRTGQGCVCGHPKGLSLLSLEVTTSDEDLFPMTRSSHIPNLDQVELSTSINIKQASSSALTQWPPTLPWRKCPSRGTGGSRALGAPEWGGQRVPYRGWAHGGPSHGRIQGAKRRKESSLSVSPYFPGIISSLPHHLSRYAGGPYVRKLRHPVVRQLAQDHIIIKCRQPGFPEPSP